MPTYRAVNTETGDVTEYSASAPDPVHLSPPWECFLVESATAPSTPPPTTTPTSVFGGRRRLTKLEFIQLLGAAYTDILALAKTNIQVESWVKRLELATPDADGTSVDLDDPRTQAGVRWMEGVLIGAGKVSAGWADGVLNG